MSMLSIGVTGITAAQYALLTTSNNIANADTDGYSRQTTTQAANVAVLTGAGYIGQGAHITSVTRVYNSFLQAQVVSTQSSYNAVNTEYTYASQVDELLSSTTSGLSTSLSSFFTALQDAISDPSSVSARQSAVSAAQTLTSQFQSMSSQLSDLYDAVNEQISSTVDSINSYASSIAELNSEILKARAATGQEPNDLLDQRDQAVVELSKLVGVTTSEDSNGNYNVYIANGQQLVAGTQTRTVTVVQSSDDPERLTIGLLTNSGTSISLSEDQITGGSLAGLISFRTDTLDAASNALGQIAVSLATTFNAQQQLGQDLDGNTAADVSSFLSEFFTISDPTVISDSNNSDTSTIVSASFLAPSVDSDTGAYYSTVTSSDYTLSMTSSGDYQLVRESDGHTWTGADFDNLVDSDGSNSSSEGFEISLDSGSISAGDSFLIEPTRNAASSISVNSAVVSNVDLLALASPVTSSASLSNTGGMTIDSPDVLDGYTLSNIPTTLTYDASAEQLTGFPSGSTITATYSDGTTATFSAGSVDFYSGTATLSNVTFDGLSVDVSGTPKQGDTFTIDVNSDGVSDSSNGTKLGLLQTQDTSSSGTASYSDLYAKIVSKIGTQTSQLEINTSAQESLLTAATDARDAVSAVSTDEEAANLIKYQQAYQASAKILEIAGTLFDTLIQI
jgi:flagellar hook-associated protein 1